jgi:hypothetical protein
MKKKFYLLTISINFGQGIAYQTHPFSTKGDPDKWADRWLRDFYSDHDRSDKNGHWFMDECVLVTGSTREVTPEEFAVLQKYL